MVSVPRPLGCLLLRRRRHRLCSHLTRWIETTVGRPIIHRDLKPDNVLLSASRAAAKIGDFDSLRCEGATEHSFMTREARPSRAAARASLSAQSLTACAHADVLVTIV